MFPCRIICSCSVKNIIGILMGVTLSLYFALGSMIIFCFFPEYRSCTSLVRFIPRYVILFDAVIYWLFFFFNSV